LDKYNNATDIQTNGQTDTGRQLVLGIASRGKNVQVMQTVG